MKDFTKNYVETTPRQPVTNALSDVLGREVRIAVTVDASVSPPQLPQDDEPAAEKPRSPSGRPAAKLVPVEDPHLNPRYTFDTFVPGASNQPLRSRGGARGGGEPGQDVQPCSSTGTRLG